MCFAQQPKRRLVDHARGKRADKRGGDWPRVTLNEEINGKEEQVLGVSARTVGEGWAVAKMWLRREIEGNDDKK